MVRASASSRRETAATWTTKVAPGVAAAAVETGVGAGVLGCVAAATGVTGGAALEAGAVLAAVAAAGSVPSGVTLGGVASGVVESLQICPAGHVVEAAT